MRDDEEVTEQGDDFEVYERKRPRPEARPGSVPDTSQGGDPGASTSTSGDADGEDAWLMAPPDPAPEAPPTTAADPGPRRGLLGALYGREEEDTPDVAALPDPPAEPMRVEAAHPPGPPSVPPPARSTSSPSQGAARPTGSVPPGGDTMRIAIAATEFNYDITHMMIERAKAHAEFLGASITHVVRVPGVYDLPLAVKRLLKRGDVDGVATIGVVIEGETDHDDLVIQHAARKIIDLSLEHDKPAGLGITGPGMSRLQAEARIDRAKDAVEACVKLHRSLAGL